MGERTIDPKFNVHEKYNNVVRIKNPYRYVSGGGGFDADAQAFITAAVITDSTQQNAINTLVVGLKADSLWSKMKAIYPFVGGTADTHKYNLKDPQDTDAAFRLSFNSGWTHASTGAMGNGVTSYADTHLIEDTVLTLNDMHISVYPRTHINALNPDIGATDGTNQTNIFPNFGGNFYPRVHASNSGTGVSLNTTGLFTANRVNGTEVFGYKNSTKYIVSSSSTGKVTTYPYWLGGMNNAGLYSPRELAFSTIGDGLTDTEQGNLYTRVQAYQTELSRQV